MTRSKGFNKGKLIAAVTLSAVMLASATVSPYVAFAAETDASGASVSKYTTDYDSWQDTLDAAAELNEQIIGVNTPEQLAETEKYLRQREKSGNT